MPSYSTPEPLTLLVDVAGADLTVRAGATTETTVDVRPHNAARRGDVDLAAAVTVEQSGTRVVVRGPRGIGSRLIRGSVGGGDRVDIDVTLPEGSALEVRGWGELSTHGALGRVDVDSTMGDIHVERAGSLRTRTSAGDVRVETVEGDADLKTSAGSVRVTHAGGALTGRTAAGDVVVDEGAGPLDLSTTAGDVRVGHARAGLAARAAAGDVRVASAHAGALSVDSSFGRVDLGIAAGVAAWLDVDARHGAVRSELESTGEPAEGEPTVEVRVRAGYGDVILRRA